jgi:hypothetical protein
MRKWKPLTDEQKDGTILLLGIPEAKIGPWLGYFSMRQNCWLCWHSSGAFFNPTHYDTLEGLLF